MDLIASGFQYNSSEAADPLAHDEVVAVVDDDPSISEPLKIFFEENGLRTVVADSGEGFRRLLSAHKIALALLDIGLPDIDGKAILPELKEHHPDTAILMLTGVSDLQTAMDCLRNGADDYLAKPVQLGEILLAVQRNLERRRLVLQNRQYQKDLENANFRIQLMHQLSLKMNTVYLNTVELDEILQAVLVGITANEGLRFNRAFLALVDTIDGEECLRGRLAIGPGCREEAEKIWGELQQKDLDFFDIVDELKACHAQGASTEITEQIRSLEIPLAQTDNILIRSLLNRTSVKVEGGHYRGDHVGPMVEFMGHENFIVVPLYSPGRPLGVIIADNFITGRPISDGHVSALELFSSQASLAIEHSKLYMDMEATISKLESVNYELAKNKDMLIEAERFSALGHMAAQMVHNIRNPITAIGGVSRLLAKRVEGHGVERFTDVLIKETSRLESILTDLFDFVSNADVHRSRSAMEPLIRKALLLVQNDIARQGITVEFRCEDPAVELDIDPEMIRKMFVHLLKNAVEAMPDGGTLSIAMGNENGWLAVAVTNTGKAIDAEHISRALEPFFTTKVYGTGMGLTMVNRIVEAHNGSFTIEKVENGTRAVVKLPIAG